MDVQIRTLSEDTSTGVVRVTVPPDVLDKLEATVGAEPGDSVVVRAQDGCIEVVPVSELIDAPE